MGGGARRWCQVNCAGVSSPGEVKPDYKGAVFYKGGGWSGGANSIKVLGCACRRGSVGAPPPPPRRLVLGELVAAGGVGSGGGLEEYGWSR